MEAPGHEFPRRHPVGKIGRIGCVARPGGGDEGPESARKWCSINEAGRADKLLAVCGGNQDVAGLEHLLFVADPRSLNEAPRLPGHFLLHATRCEASHRICEGSGFAFTAGKGDAANELANFAKLDRARLHDGGKAEG